jgi:protein-tyrosine phosphatase
MTAMYRNRGIQNIMNHPVSDLDIDEYCGMLFKAAKVLNKLAAKGEKVLVYCTTGASRSMTLLIVYFALFLKHPQWQNLDELERFLKQEEPRSTPNMAAAYKTVRDNVNFQKEIMKKLEDEEANRRKGMDDAERRKLLLALQDELDRLRRTRMAEEEQERLRL